MMGRGRRLEMMLPPPPLQPSFAPHTMRAAYRRAGRSAGRLAISAGNRPRLYSTAAEKAAAHRQRA